MWDCAGGFAPNRVPYPSSVYDCADGIANWQEVYGMLEEPDGLAGLVRLRSGPARLQDQLLAAEKAGSWAEALALREQALQHHNAGKSTAGVSFLTW